MRTKTLLICLAAAAMLAAGCGGGDDSAEPTPVTTSVPEPSGPTKEELIAQGDAICAEVNAAVGGIEAGEAEGAADQVADLYVGMVESLRRLGTPEEAEGFSELSQAADELSRAEGEVKLASERGDGDGLATAESNAASALESFRSAAEAYGLEECGEGPSAPAAAPGAEGGLEPEAPEEATEAPAEEEEEVAPEAAPEGGGAAAGGVEEGGGAPAGGGTGGGAAGGGGESGGSSGGIGPG